MAHRRKVEYTPPIQIPSLSTPIIDLFAFPLVDNQQTVVPISLLSIDVGMKKTKEMNAKSRWKVEVKIT
jgi:hypothetical protein